LPSRLGRSIFVLLAPLSVPAYLLFLGAAQLLGAAYYIVLEATLERLLGRPIGLSRGWFIALALPVLLLAPLAAACHLVLFSLKWIGRTLCGLGVWQTGAASTPLAFSAGLAWALIAVWTSVTCLNAALGAALIGRPITGRDAFVENFRRDRSLKHLPAEMQQRRQSLLAELAAGRFGAAGHRDLLRSLLDDDDVSFRMLPPVVAARLADLPWFFVPGELSSDGADHSVLLLGPLLFVWLMLIRWPGLLALFRPSLARGGFFLLRMVIAAGAIHAIITWLPATATSHFEFPRDEPGRLFHLLSPAGWIGIDWMAWSRPEWYLLNIALWMILFAALGYLSWLAWRIAPLVGWPRHYVPFLAARLLQRKRIAFFSVGAVTLCVAMMIIVISVMGGFVDSIRQRAHGLLGDLVMDGGLQGFPYYQEFIDKIRDLRDEKTGRPLVVQATPLIRTYGILQFPHTRKTTAVNILGVKLDEYVRVNEFGKDLFYNNRYGGTHLARQMQPFWGFDETGVAALPGDMDRRYRAYVEALPPEERAREVKEFQRRAGEPFPGPGLFARAENLRPTFAGAEYPGVIIGRSILFRRNATGEYNRNPDYPRGQACRLTVMPVSRGGEISQEPPPSPPFRYVDDSRTGIHEIDSMNVYVDFDYLQDLLSMRPEQRRDGTMTSARCIQIQIKIAEPHSATRASLEEIKRIIWNAWTRHRSEVPADQIELRLLHNVDVQTWEEMQASYISAIEKEKFLVLIMFGVISIVAVFLILCIFYMIVQEKTRDIGIIKSVGGSAEGVAAVFLAYGGAIGLVGSILGSLLGVTFVEHINDIQDWLARINPDWRVWSPETYSFDRIPDVWKWSEVIGIGILAIISSIVGAAFPAIRAGRTWPVETLRYE